jgi:transposase
MYYNEAMHIEFVPNRNSRPTVLLRKSYRKKGKSCKQTLANLTELPRDQIESIRSILKGEQLVPIDSLFEILKNGSPAHGHVEAVMLAMKQLGFENLIASRPSRERNLVVGMVAARIIEPKSKLATSRWWHDTTLPEILAISDADEDDLYAAMDWVYERQKLIEKKLAARHLENGGIALYDLTSSYFEGVTCPLAALGHNRDGKKGKLQVNYGLLTNQQGIPVCVSVFEGNKADTKTLMPQVLNVKDQFGIEQFAMVGDRGMITQTQIDELKGIEGIDWITALRSEGIGKLIEDGSIQMGLFDERNLFELMHTKYPDERLVACRNPELAKHRAQKRKELIEATCRELEKVRKMVQRDRLSGKEQINTQVQKVLKNYKIGKFYKLDIRDDSFDFKLDEVAMAEARARITRSGNPKLADKWFSRCERHKKTIATKLEKIRQRIVQGRLYGKDKIGLRTGKVVNKYKVSKHFKLDIRDNGFDYEIDELSVATEAALDGIYVIRTSLSAQRMSTDDTVRSYKLLTQVERAIRAMKTISIKTRPIGHRLENRVRAHIFLCMLAYYVEWYMIEAWRPLLFCDEDQEAKASRDPVAPAKRSDKALQKVHTKELDDGSTVYSFKGLLEHLGALVRNICRCKGAGKDAPTFHMPTPPNSKQQRAFDLLKGITV